MTATLTAPANGAGGSVLPANAAKRGELWGEGIDIPLIVGTGDYGTGKTTFGISICPGPETLVFDNEGSSLPWKRQLNFDHVDMADELRKAHGEKFTAQQRYLWWREEALKRGKTGKYRVLVVDPASELEDGLAEYIKTHVSEFGLTAAQLTQSSGLFWGVMKSEWKKTLDLLRTYFETTYLTVHLRQKFIGNKPDPAGTLEPKGKETLYELSSLFLWFEKNDKTACPTAKVEKSRLSKFVMNGDEFTPIAILPPQLPRATPKAIRDYIAAPPDYSKLSKAEKVREHVMSEDEKLRYNATIAVAQAETASAEYNKLAMMQQQAAALTTRQAAIVPPPDQSAAYAQQHAAKVAANAANVRPPISQSQIASIVTLLTELFGSPSSPAANEWLAPRIAAYGVTKPTEMTDAQGDGLQSELLALSSQKRQDAMAARGKELMTGDQSSIRNQPPADPPFVPSEQPAPQDSTVQIFGKIDPSSIAGPPVSPQLPTAEQKAEANHLIPLAFPDPAVRGTKLPALVLKHGATRPDLLTYQQMESVLAELRQLSTANMVPPAPRAKPETIARLREWCEKTGWSRDKQQQWLEANGGLKNFSEASEEQVASIIEMLVTIEASFKGGPPGN